MTTKAAQTSQYILETVAPIFNKMGYSATSMSALTKATKLTKGAIYGNFKNKEELAIASFNFNVSFIMNKLKLILTEIASPLEKFQALTDFYRNYYEHNLHFGGCPILNVGIDAINTNPKLYARAKDVAYKLEKGIEAIILQGITQKEIEENTDAKKVAGRIYSFIEGAVFTSMLHKNDKYILDMMDHIDDMVTKELKRS